MRRILFVDDEPGILAGLRASLRRRRGEWEMHFVSSAAEAMSHMRCGSADAPGGPKQPLDVLVTDLRLSGGDGAALLEQAREISPTTVRIVLSGYANERMAMRTVSLAHRFLLKPCASDALERNIDRCLGVRALVGSEAVRAKLGGVGSLPSVPSTFARLQNALAEPSADAKAVACVVESDPAVVAKILQVVNSAFFRLPRPVERVEQAVSYLGLQAILSLTLCTEIFSDPTPLPKALDLNHLQAHSMAVARIARGLAAGRPFADEAFLAALLHDVGLLVMARVYCKPMQTALASATPAEAFATLERELAIDHGMAGGYLLGLWGCGYGVVDSVAHHHAVVSGTPGVLDVHGCVALAEAAVAAVRPDLVPTHERAGPEQGGELCRQLALPESWESLCDRAKMSLPVTDPT